MNFSREQQALLEKCARTTLSSKLIARQREFFAKMVVDAVLMLDELLPLNMYVLLNKHLDKLFVFRIGIKKVTGGSLEESRLVAGVAFKKTFSYAGFEMQQKKYLKPKIALLNIELELKAERDNAEIRLDNVAVRFSYPIILFLHLKYLSRNIKKSLMRNGPFFMINSKNFIKWVQPWYYRNYQLGTWPHNILLIGKDD